MLEDTVQKPRTLMKTSYSPLLPLFFPFSSAFCTWLFSRSTPQWFISKKHCLPFHYSIGSNDTGKKCYAASSVRRQLRLVIPKQHWLWARSSAQQHNTTTAQHGPRVVFSLQCSHVAGRGNQICCSLQETLKNYLDEQCLTNPFSCSQRDHSSAVQTGSV